MRRTVICLAIIAMVSGAFAAVTDSISFQGKVIDAISGIPLEGANNVTFRIYDVETGGTASWTETQSVMFVDGLYNVLLGNIASLTPTLSFNGPYWISVQIGTGDEMERKPLTTSPYAFNAKSTEGIHGNPISDTGPGDEQILKWNNAESLWEPADDETGGVGTIENLTDGNGITDFTYNGSSAATVAVSFAGTGSANTVTRSDHNHDATYANRALSNLSSVAINTSLLPASDNSIDLGSSTKEWRNLYVDGTAHCDAIELGGVTRTTWPDGSGLWTDNGTYIYPNDNPTIRTYDDGELYAIWSSSGTSAYGGWFGSTNCAVFGKCTAYSNQFGYLGDANYGAYGRHDSGRYGILGGANYGAFGKYGSGDVPYGGLGSIDAGVYGYGTSSTYAGKFEGDVRITGKLHDSSGDAGTSGYVLSSTGSGTNWITGSGSGDNLGNHTATENLKMAGYNIENADYIWSDWFQGNIVSIGVSSSQPFNCYGTYIMTTGDLYLAGSDIEDVDNINIKDIYDNGVGTIDVYASLDVDADASADYAVRGDGNPRYGYLGYTGSINTSGPDYGGAGVYGDNSGVGIFGESSGSQGVSGYSTGEAGIMGQTNNTSKTGVYGRHLSPSPYKYGYLGGNSYGVYYSGGLAGTGTKSCIIRIGDDAHEMYCQESPENWFEDFGEGKLTNGRCHIELEPLFKEACTIDDSHPIQVFITPYGDMNRFKVVRGKTGFDIEELDGASNSPFGYRVVAKRKGYENLRMKNVDATFDALLYPELHQNDDPSKTPECK